MNLEQPQVQKRKNGDAACDGYKIPLSILTLLQKCPLAVEFCVSQVQPIRACRKALLIPVLLNGLQWI
jgi:hypothetical protein